MQILLVAATAFEVALFLEQYPAADHLITGVGAAVSVYHITKRLQQIDYDIVIQAGIAGAFDTSSNLADVVLVKRDRFADVGMSEQNIFSSVFEKSFADENEFPFSKGWLENNHAYLENSLLKKVNAVTINTVTDDATLKNQLVPKYHPVIETMEGAALHYTCLQEQVSFLQLRSISNYVGERDKNKWKMKDAIENLNDELVKIVKHLYHA